MGLLSIEKDSGWKNKKNNKIKQMHIFVKNLFLINQTLTVLHIYCS